MAKTNKLLSVLCVVLALLLCISLLPKDGTLAWFSDSESTALNTIQSGDLDVVLQYKTDWNGTWANVEDDTMLFKQGAFYEPGYTETVFLRVANGGNLAFKYDLNVDVVEETKGVNDYEQEFALSDYLQIGSYVQDETSTKSMSDMFGTRKDALDNAKNFNVLANSLIFGTEQRVVLPGEKTAQVIALVLTMPETVGNEANTNGVKHPSITLGINLVATQAVSESDSYGSDYDKDVTIPVIADNAADLADALKTGESVILAANVALDEEITIPANVEVALDLNGKTITAPAGAICAIQNEGTLTVTGNGTIKGSYTALYSNGSLTIENGTFTATDGFGVLIDNINGTEASVAVINGGIFTGIGIYNPTNVTVNGGTFNVGRDPDGATDHLSDKMTLFINPTFVGAPNTANVVLNGGTFNGDIYVYDDGITETVFVNNGATITGSVLDNA